MNNAPVRRGITGDLIEQFKQLIRDGVLVSGCRMPPERELSQILGVNRSSLRQALKVLQEMGIIHQRVGDGTYLSGDPGAGLRHPLEFLMLSHGVTDVELFDFRLMIEPELAAVAAKRASPQDRAAIAAALQMMERDERPEAAFESDLSFHKAIVQAAGNRACLFILTEIHDAILQSMKEPSARVPSDTVLRLHKAIYRAIEKRDAAAARRAMSRHLRVARDALSLRTAAKQAPRSRPAPVSKSRPRVSS